MGGCWLHACKYLWGKLGSALAEETRNLEMYMVNDKGLSFLAHLSTCRSTLWGAGMYSKL